MMFENAICIDYIFENYIFQKNLSIFMKYSTLSYFYGKRMTTEVINILYLLFYCYLQFSVLITINEVNSRKN